MGSDKNTHAPNNSVPPDTTAEISQDGIVFLRQARLFSDEPVEVEQFSWSEIDENKITIDDIESISSRDNGSNDFSTTLQNARVSFGRQTKIETTHNSSSDTFSEREIWSELEERCGIQFDHENSSINFDGSKTDKDNYVCFFMCLSASSMLSELEIPYKAKSAKNYTLNTEPMLREDKEMARPVEISDDIWLETQIPKEQKKTNMARIVGKIAEGGS